MPQFEHWVEKLRDRQARVKIVRRMESLAKGNFGDHKNVGGGVFELRIDYGPGYRVYYVQRKQVLIVLLCGGDKSTQVRDIARAKALALTLKEESL